MTHLEKLLLAFIEKGYTVRRSGKYLYRVFTSTRKFEIDVQFDKIRQRTGYSNNDKWVGDIHVLSQTDFDTLISKSLNNPKK